MTKKKNPALEEHFDKLKEILPELYHPINKLPRNISEKLYGLLKNSLSIIEAVYLQNPDSFSSAKVDAYSEIISDLRKLGIIYRGNEDILSKAASQLLSDSKMPMERAGLRKQVEQSKKQAG